MPWPWMAIDLETSGTKPEYALQPWRVKQGKAWITTVAVSRRKPSGEITSDGRIYPDRDYLRGLLMYAIAKRKRVIVWNGDFDIAWLIAYGLGDLVDQVDWLDAMLAWKHVDLTPSFASGHSYSLKGEGGAIDTFCPKRQGYQEGVDYHDRSPEALARLLAYNIEDTEATLICAEEIWVRVWSKRAAELEAAALPLVARANLRGLRVNRKATVALYEKLTATVDKMAIALAPHGVTETVIRSPKQLSTLLFDAWGLPDLKDRSTAKEVLTELIIEDDRADLLMQFREALNLRSKFIGGIVKSCEYNEDKLTRPQGNIFGTYTSRMTYTSTQTVTEPGARAGTTRKAQKQIGFALHQMKRSKDFRSLILAPEDHDVVEFDAAGQEFRWMGILSGDETMLELCLPGEDPHSFMAAAIYQGDYREIQAGAAAEDPAAKKKRQGGKFANLSAQYRTGVKTLRIRARTDHGLKLSEHEAAHIHRTYPRTYKGVPKYWDRQIQFGRQFGYAETLAGRRIKIKGSWVGPHAWSMESTMINYPVQGTGGEQKYLAMAVVKDRLAEYNARFAWDLHDGIYFYVPKTKSMKFAVEIREVLDHLPYEEAWDFSPPIPLPWDAKIGPSWGELTPVKD